MGEHVRLVVHGHFYQPPRENPWTEVVPVEPSAAPAHDWNERITAECYRPNGWARVVDEAGRVAGIIDNYASMSFNVGPTLCAWLERHHPDVLARMVAADAEGGGAIAQAYNHSILPLCNERDLRTQVRWGLADFRHRFGRDPVAMWLPETAVNDAVLAVLAEEGVRATILAPNQALGVRPLDHSSSEWRDVSDGSVTQGTPHRWFHPTEPSLSVDLVFYDGALSHDLAFALSGLSSQDLVQRVLATSADGSPVVVATDGETFGHHHKFADRALAYTFAHEAPAHDVRALSLATLLDEVAPWSEVRVRESAWSCAHGVGRWKEDCGCSTGGEPGWRQAWRAPLRAALDVLRDHGVEVFERRAPAVLTDPWAARDDYIEVLLGRQAREDFVARWATPGADPVLALSLLEAQRQALLMYTSCGWFFNDLAGIETVQVLRYAARVLDLLEELGEAGDVRDRFLAVLGEARSNRPDEGSGADIWQRHVEPSRVDGARVVAHLALLDLLEQREAGPVVGGHRVVRNEHRLRRRGGIAGVAGRTELEHVRTGRRTTHVYAAMRLAGLEVVGAVRAAADAEHDEACFARVAEATSNGSRVTAVLRLIDECFGPQGFGLEAALPEAAGDIVASSAERLADRVGAAMEGLWADNRDLLVALSTAGHPLGPELLAPVEFALGRQLRRLLDDVVTASERAGGGDDLSFARDAAVAASDAAWEGRRLGVRAEALQLGAELADAVRAATARCLVGVDGGGPDPLAVEVVTELLSVRRRLDVGIDLGRAQEIVVDAAGRGVDVDGLGELLGVAARPGGSDR